MKDKRLKEKEARMKDKRTNEGKERLIKKGWMNKLLKIKAARMKNK